MSFGMLITCHTKLIKQKGYVAANRLSNSILLYQSRHPHLQWNNKHGSYLAWAQLSADKFSDPKIYFLISCASPKKFYDFPQLPKTGKNQICPKLDHSFGNAATAQVMKKKSRLPSSPVHRDATSSRKKKSQNSFKNRMQMPKTPKSHKPNTKQKQKPNLKRIYQLQTTLKRSTNKQINKMHHSIRLDFSNDQISHMAYFSTVSCMQDHQSRELPLSPSHH